MKAIWIILAFMVGFTGLAIAQKSKKVPEVKITTVINVPIDSAFDYILPVDLSHIFKRYKRFPAIVKTNETLKWNRAGLSRTVFFEDGTTAQESMLSVIPNQSFSYKIENFTSSLKMLAKRIDGEYEFINLGNNQTKIIWTYQLIPKNFVTRTVINITLIKDLRELLTNALATLKNDLEGVDNTKLNTNAISKNEKNEKNN